MIKQISLVLLFIFSACGSDPKSDPIQFPVQIKFEGIGSIGIFDPSVALDTSTNELWMTYTEVHPSVMWPEANPEVASIRLARSTDGGKSWSDSGIYLSQAYDVTVTTGDTDIYEGTWMSEVSQIIYDPWEDDSNKRWKLIWHHYLRIDHVYLTFLGQDSRRFEHGWIALKEASSPAGLASAAEIKLFTASAYDVVNNDTSGNTQSPVGGPAAIEYHTMTGADSIVVTEPGLLTTDSGIYISMVSFDSSADSSIHLLKHSRTGSMQDSGTWTFSGIALSDSDAVPLGYLKFSASELYEKNGNTYLLVSPVSSTPWENAYNGCMTFGFADLDSAVLEGSPTVINYIHGDEGSFNGACECDAALSYGFIYGQVYPDDDEMFRIFYSGVIP